MAKPAPVPGSRHGAWPATQATPATAPHARHTMRCWLSPVRASYLAGLPAARSRSALVTPPRLLRGRAVADSRDPGEMAADEPLERDPPEHHSPEHHSPEHHSPEHHSPEHHSPEHEPLEQDSLERQI